MSRKYYFPCLFFLLVILCILIYWNGLKGGFIFDDFVNLQDLGVYGTIDSWDKVKAFVFNGFSGPTGRPISLLSFLIDDNTWPSQAPIFKYTNLMIHLINSLLLFWAILLLLQYYKYKDDKAMWIAIVTASMWMLHPYFVSTTLYVVQRMAQLATLFSLVGVIGYLKGCENLKIKPWKAYLLMSSSVFFATLMATFSKENGALLPLLLLVIEFCNPNKENCPKWQWKTVFLWLPSIAIVCVLAKYITFADHPWPNRNFNMVERLYSETRILSTYLYNLFIPQVELQGLYQDGFLVSKSLIQPITTLYSVIFLTTLLVSAIFLRKKYPLYTLAILFFFAAHIMESTVIGLELYFEHRNYLSAIFLFLPLASALYKLRSYINPILVNFIFIVIILILSFFTYQRANLWSNTDKLQIYWAKNSPNSQRAQNGLATILFEYGRVNESNQYLQAAIKNMPDSALLNLRQLLNKVYLNQATNQDFKDTAEKLETQPFDGQALMAVRTLIEYVTQSKKNVTYPQASLMLLNALNKNSNYNQTIFVKKLIPYLSAKIYLADNHSQKALDEYLKAILVYNDVESGLMMVAELVSSGYPQEALMLLNKVEQMYKLQSTETLRRSRHEYNQEISRIHLLLQQQIVRGKIIVKN